MIEFSELASQTVAAFGLGAVVMVIVQLLKMFNVVPDGKAGWVVSMLNVGIMIILMAAKVVFGIDLEGESAQAVLTTFASVAQALLAILASVGTFHLARKAQMLK